MLAYHPTADTALSLGWRAGFTLTTDKNRTVTVRPGGAADGDLVWEMHRRLSNRTIWLRYGAPKQLMPEATLRAGMADMLGADPRLSTTLVGTVVEGGALCAVSLAQIVHDPRDRTAAEVAIVVRDDYQREGLGRRLSRLMRAVALARGVRAFHVHALAENQAVVRLIRGLGVPYTVETRRGETTAIIPLQYRQ